MGPPDRGGQFYDRSRVFLDVAFERGICMATGLGGPMGLQAKHAVAAFADAQVIYGADRLLLPTIEHTMMAPPVSCRREPPVAQTL